MDGLPSANLPRPVARYIFAGSLAAVLGRYMGLGIAARLAHRLVQNVSASARDVWEVSRGRR